MIDATTGHEALSSMDCTARYNLIQMALKIKTAFVLYSDALQFEECGNNLPKG